MLTRRYLRIKVMQALYTYELNQETNLELAHKNLLKSIREAYRIYIYKLYFCALMCRQVLVFAKTAASKNLPSEEDLNVNTILSENKVAEMLLNHTGFLHMLVAEKLDKFDEREILNTLFRELHKTEQYKNYLADGHKTERGQIEFFLFIGHSFLAQKALFDSHMDELFFAWQGDQKTAEYLFTNNLEAFIKNRDHSLFMSAEEEQDADNFSSTLFKLTLANTKEFNRHIKPRLQNWDMERISLLDLVSMRMAMTEFLYFNTIPVKVSLNEYLEISKLYSTPKSKDFVNGILDPIMKELKESGRILKTGRGLNEN